MRGAVRHTTLLIYIQNVPGADLLKLKYMLTLFNFAAESCAMDTLRNSWRLFIHWKVMDSYHDAEKIKMVQLKEPYRTEQSLGKLIDRIEAFRT